MRRRGPSPFALAALVLVTVGACAHPATSTTVPDDPDVAWIDGALLGSPPAEVETLAQLEGGGARARLVRLDRLIDLLDAARFAQDEDARETLWGALGGHATGVGERATREATERLLQEAMALAEQAGDPSSDAGSLCADAIMMLTTDLQGPTTAEDLSIRTLVYRTLVEQGHPRIADNARWRLYDHARGTLAGAIEAPAAQRMEIAVQALYAAQDSVEPLLADTAPHARPPWPAPESLWGLVEQQRAALAELPRWAAVVRKLDGEDGRLHDTLRTVLPSVRDEAWPLPMLPAGTGRAESLAPVLYVHGPQLTIDAGRSHQKTLPLDTEMVELSRAIGNALAQDGRGTALLVADPLLPAPQLRTALRAIVRAHAERIELAVREPRLDAEADPVVMALPLYVTQTGGTRAGDRAWAEARVHAHLDGRGARIAIDGQWLSARPVDSPALAALVRSVAQAYPRERGVRLSLGSDVQLQQVLDLLVALQGGPQRPFAAVGYIADGARPPEGPADGDGRLDRRLALRWTTPKVDLQQPYPLSEQDQKRLEGFAEAVAVCLPELEAERAPAQVVVRLRFEEGRLRSTAIEAGRKPPKAGVAAVSECIEEEGYGLRLRSHREGIDVAVTLSPGGPTTP